MGSLRGGVGTKPPARGSTPAPRPKLGGYSYNCIPLTVFTQLRGISVEADVVKRCGEKSAPE